MENNPLVSVIVPCYNIAEKLPKCLETLLGQTYTKFEIICINDASTDQTLHVINRFKNIDSRIIVHNLSKNGGLANGRREGIRLAKGDFICFVDGDDWVKSDYLQTLISAQQKHNSDLVVCECYYQAFRQISIKRRTASASLNNIFIHDDDLQPLSVTFFGNSQFPLSMWGKLYRKEIFNLKSIPEIHVFFQEDVLLNLYIFNAIKSIEFFDYCGYYYRMGGGTSEVSRRYIDDMKDVYRIKKHHLDTGIYSSPNSMNWIIIELKNCLYIYFQRLIKSRRTYDQIIDEAKSELSDKLYDDFKLLSGEYKYLLESKEFVAVIEKDIKMFLTLANKREGLKRRIINIIKKVVN